MPPTSAIIINWNTREHLLRCVDSFLSDGLQPSLILVVDQGSSDGSLHALQTRFPDVRFLSLKDNIGYAHAVNRGVAELHDPYIIVANSDIIVHKGTAGSLANVMQGNENIGMLGCKMLNGEGRNATRFSRTSVTRGILLELAPKFLRGLWRDTEQLVRQDEQPFPVTFVEGAFLMIRREAFLSIGGMDEGFTFFYEDADMPMRMIKSGYHVLHVPQASVTHFGGASFSQVPQRHASEFHRNMIRLYGRHALRRAVWLKRVLRAVAGFKVLFFKAFSPIVGSGMNVKTRIERNRIILQSLTADLQPIRNERPLVSVIVPTFNRSHSVQSLIDNLRKQTYTHCEIIIVDQSDDGGMSALDTAGEGIRWLKLKKANRSLAKNVGMNEARGDILLFCDDDIIPEKTMVETHVRAHSDVSVGGVSCRVMEEGLPPITSTNICRVMPYGRMIDGFQSDAECFVETLVGANMSIKRQVLKEAGYFDSLFTGTSLFEEQDFSERIRHLGFRILFTNKSSVRHIPQPDGNIGFRIAQPSAYYHSFHHNELVFFLKNRNHLLLLFVIPFCFLRTVRQSLRYRLSFREGMHIFAGVFSGIRGYYRSMK